MASGYAMQSERRSSTLPITGHRIQENLDCPRYPEGNRPAVIGAIQLRRRKPPLIQPRLFQETRITDERIEYRSAHFNRRPGDDPLAGAGFGAGRTGL